MPVPTSYTEESLAVFMDATLGEVADLLGWSANGVTTGSYGSAVEDALVACGVKTIDQITNVAKLRAAAKVSAWTLACTALLTRYDFQSEQQSFRRSQMVDNAKVQLARAESEAATYGVIPGWSVEASPLVHDNDPYDPITGTEVA